MDNKKIKELIFGMEYNLWKEASNRDVVEFKSLVADDAVMICRVYRCLGLEYAEYIKDFYINSYDIKNEDVIFLSKEAIQIHYVIDVKTELPEVTDLGGTFHVVSLWKKMINTWNYILTWIQELFW